LALQFFSPDFQLHNSQPRAVCRSRAERVLSQCHLLTAVIETKCFFLRSPSTAVMFHTFETISHASGEQSSANASSKQKRRTSTVRACEPCRRRKIRCNGNNTTSVVWLYAEISRLARRTPVRDLYVVPKSGDLSLYRAPPETSAVSKVCCLISYLELIPQTWICTDFIQIDRENIGDTPGLQSSVAKALSNLASRQSPERVSRAIT
jgi:hypothetical protein